jgi:hypothetical protein
MSSDPATNRFADLDTEYAERSGAASGQVVRWEWAPEGARWEVPVPIWGELNATPVSDKPLRRPPADPARGEHYGYDAEDRIVVRRSYASDGQPRYERFIVYRDDVIESVTYVHDPTLYESAAAKAITTAELVDERVARFREEYANGERADQVLHWEGTRLVAMEMVAQLNDGSNAPTRETFTYRYEPTGQLAMIRAEAERRVIYRRPPRHLRKTVMQLEQALGDAIQRAATIHAPPEPVCAVVLMYDIATLLPPAVGVLSERQRLAILAGDSPRDVMDLWNPADFETFVADPAELVVDDQTAEQMAAINTHIALTDDDRLLRKITTSVAKGLNTSPWPASLHRTADFAVAATDSDLENLSRDLRATVPAPLLAQLRARGLT